MPKPKPSADPFGFAAAINIDHLTDAQVALINDIFDKDVI